MADTLRRLRASAPVTAESPSFASARYSMARIQVTEDASLEAAFARATSIGAKVLGVARVGVWLFEPDGRSLRCAFFHGAGGVAPPPRYLDGAAYPRYVDALHAQRWVAADDVETEEIVGELLSTYLRPQGIRAMLDAPLFRGAELVGVVCHEHVGGPRHWTPEDRAFAGSVADTIALALEQQDRLSAEALAREQLARSQQGHKMEALGRMASAVAHDVNNLLAAIDAMAATLERAPGEESAAKAAASIRDVVSRGAGLTRQLLTFGRSMPPTHRTLDLRQVITGMEPILAALVKGQCDLDIATGQAPLLVHGDSVEVQQVLLNLGLNARDAMPDGGVLRIFADVGISETGGSLAVVTVADEGHGMSEDVLARAFEPFYSTKDPSEGTGLGLSTVYGIVRKMGGVIDVDTQPGSGTLFTISFPLG
ncbi:MAG: GAF domain-containing protein [Polyangiaceae bacterium]|nr:GAF domain-containing protein [Polyangiaceae bacterium]